MMKTQTNCSHKRSELLSASLVYHTSLEAIEYNKRGNCKAARFSLPWLRLESIVFWFKGLGWEAGRVLV
jgi:hypothetical protein